MDIRSFDRLLLPASGGSQSSGDGGDASPLTGRAPQGRRHGAGEERNSLDKIKGEKVRGREGARRSPAARSAGRPRS